MACTWCMMYYMPEQILHSQAMSTAGDHYWNSNALASQQMYRKEARGVTRGVVMIVCIIKANSSSSDLCIV